MPGVAAAAVVGRQPQPNMPCSPAGPVEEEEDPEAGEAAGACNSAEVQTGFCSSL